MYIDKPVSDSSAPANRHMAAWKPGRPPRWVGFCLLNCSPSWSGSLPFSKQPFWRKRDGWQGWKGILRHGCREDYCRNLALWSARCCHPRQSKWPHPEWPGPRAAIWTACVVIPALSKRRPAKPWETWSLGQFNTFLLGPGKEEGVEWHASMAAGVTLVQMFSIFATLLFWPTALYEAIFCNKSQFHL